MCERIAQRRSAGALACAYPGLVLTDGAPLLESEEIAPGETLAVVHGNAAGAPRLIATRWGVSTPGTYRARPMTLARAESAATKREFRDATRYRRAIVPCEGWTQWRRRLDARVVPERYLARSTRNERPLNLAALVWWGNPDFAGATGVIVTAAPAPSIGKALDRQPLCLEDHEVSAWLDPDRPFADIETILAAGGAREPGVTLVRAEEARA